MNGNFITPVEDFEVKVYRMSTDAILPSRQSDEAAGYDLHTLEDFTILPGQKYVARTGIVVQPPPGLHTEVMLRSGMAYKYNIILINSVGLIDRDYAGPDDEIKVMLYKLPIPDGPTKFTKGDRIAQLVFCRTALGKIVEVKEAPKSNRGGLGSTGH